VWVWPKKTVRKRKNKRKKGVAKGKNNNQGNGAGGDCNRCARGTEQVTPLKEGRKKRESTLRVKGSHISGSALIKREKARI